MAYTAALFVFLSALCASFSLGRKKKEKINVVQRLSNIMETEIQPEAREVELKRPFSERAIKPLFSGLSLLLANFFPADMCKRLEPRLQNAGSPGRLTASEFLALKLVLVLILSAVAVFMFGFKAGQVLLFMVAGWQIPEIYLKSLIQKRHAEIEKTLPDMLDLLTVSVEAGLGFDGALSKVAEKSSGILAVEFRRVLKENRMGKSRKEALRDMAARLGAEQVTTFIGSVIQADQLGISFSKVLRVQSEQIRYKRKQKVEELAMKAPIKMLIPLVFFIFPTIFIVLLGPAAINIFRAFCAY